MEYTGFSARCVKVVAPYVSLLAIVAGVVLVGCSGSERGTDSNTGSMLREVDPNIPLIDQISRLAGVYLNDQGQVRIRGNTQPPLVVIDGMQTMTADLDTINPADVEQVEVLKGPETARYGLRGGGGVIVITTKTGRS